MTPTEREQKGRIYVLEKENRRLLEENLKLIMMATEYQKEVVNVQRLYRE